MWELLSGREDAGLKVLLFAHHGAVLDAYEEQLCKVCDLLGVLGFCLGFQGLGRHVHAIRAMPYATGLWHVGTLELVVVSGSLLLVRHMASCCDNLMPSHAALVLSNNCIHRIRSWATCALTAPQPQTSASRRWQSSKMMSRWVWHVRSCSMM